MSEARGSEPPSSESEKHADRPAPPAGPLYTEGKTDGDNGQRPASAAAAPTDHDEAPQREEASEAPRADRERPRRSKLANGRTPHEPAQMLDLCELPETYGKDEVAILTKDPQWYFVYWEVTEGGEASAREQLGPSGAGARLVLRLFTTLTGPGGPGQGAGRETRELRDVPLPQHHGRKYLEAPRPGALVRAAVGMLSVEGYFAPIAHSALVRMPPQQAAAQTSVEWLHVLPPRSQGHKRERIIAVPPPAPHEEQPRPVRPTSPASIEAEGAAHFPVPEAPPPGSSPAAGASAAVPHAAAETAGAPPLGNGSGGLG